MELTRTETPRKTLTSVRRKVQHASDSVSLRESGPERMCPTCGQPMPSHIMAESDAAAWDRER
jgi:hypothetical protein